MFNLQGSEIIVILLLALVVLGPEKLPDAIRKFSQTYSELKKMGSGFQSEIRSALDEPMREMRETADLMKNSVDPDKLQAEAEHEAELQREAEAEAKRMALIDEAEADTAASRDRADDDDDASPTGAATDSVDPADSVEPPKPINQIAQANARGKIDSVVATHRDVDVEAIPTFADPPGEAANPAPADGAGDVDGPGDGDGSDADDDANEAAVS